MTLPGLHMTLRAIFMPPIVNHSIWKFGPDGSFLKTWGSYGTGNGQFDNPSGIAVNSSGFVYVADTQQPHTDIYLWWSVCNEMGVNGNRQWAIQQSRWYRGEQ